MTTFPLISTNTDLFRSLLRLAHEHELPRLYPEPVADFTERTITCLREDRDFDELRCPSDDSPSLLSSMLDAFSGDAAGGQDTCWCSPVLVRLASELYGCADAGVERANRILLDLLNIRPSGKDYFDQLQVRDREGRRQMYLVSTARFEREFRIRAMVPIHWWSMAHRVKTKHLDAA